MPQEHGVSRRAALVMSATLIVSRPLKAEPLRTLRVTKDPSCGCCDGWVKHMRSEGFQAEVFERSQINRIKRRLGVPMELWSCHTSELAGYVLEGHVPAHAARRLLAEKPRATGLAAAGMPVGSPGMEIDGQPPEVFDVLVFGSGKSSLFARYLGGQPA